MKDPHKEKAAEIFGVPVDKVTPAMRAVGKQKNYMEAYGAMTDPVNLNSYQMLVIDPNRMASTGIYVRAMAPDGKWINADISQLESKSLLTWLRSRGGKNEWAENVVGMLLGHKQLTGSSDG